MRTAPWSTSTSPRTSGCGSPARPWGEEHRGVRPHDLQWSPRSGVRSPPVGVVTSETGHVMGLLTRLESPADVRRLTARQVDELAAEIRDFLVQSVNRASPRRVALRDVVQERFVRRHRRTALPVSYTHLRA